MGVGRLQMRTRYFRYCHRLDAFTQSAKGGMSMERFTKKVDGVWTALCNYGSSPYPVVTQEIIDRLAAYEDTGLTPEEVQQMRWIPVEEKLPEKENAQVFMTDGESCFISSRNNMMCFLGCEGFFIPGKAANITHWMPPPDPPARRPPDGEKEKIFNE